MRQMYILLMATFLMLLSCDGSDRYQGNWKAVDANGSRFEIQFLPEEFSVKDSIGKKNVYGYSQHSVKYMNSTETYGIKLEDGRGYQIHFPTKDRSVGLIFDEFGNQMYTISRNGYTSNEEVYKLD